MKTSSKALFAIAGLIAGFGLGYLCANVSFGDGNAAGDIIKVTKYSKNVVSAQASAFQEKIMSDPEELQKVEASLAILSSRMTDFDNLVSLAVKTGEGIEALAPSVAKLQEVSKLSANAKKTAQDAIGSFNDMLENKEAASYETASQNLSLAFLMVDRQIGVGKEYVSQVDAFLKGKNVEEHASLAATRDLWAGFCAGEAILNGDNEELNYWLNQKTAITSDLLGSTDGNLNFAIKSSILFNQLANTDLNAMCLAAVNNEAILGAWKPALENSALRNQALGNVLGVKDNLYACPLSNMLMATALNDQAVIGAFRNSIQDGTISATTMLGMAKVSLWNTDLNSNLFFNTLKSNLQDGTLNDQAFFNAIIRHLNNTAIGNQALASRLGSMALENQGAAIRSSIQDGSLNDQVLYSALEASIKDGSISDQAMIVWVSAAIQDPGIGNQALSALLQSTLQDGGLGVSPLYNMLQNNAMGQVVENQAIANTLGSSAQENNLGAMLEGMQLYQNTNGNLGSMGMLQSVNLFNTGLNVFVVANGGTGEAQSSEVYRNQADMNYAVIWNTALGSFGNLTNSMIGLINPTN